MPGAAVAHDQRYRETTLAFVNRDAALSAQIGGRLAAAGARTTINSLWVLGWLGDFDKLTMTRRMMPELFDLDLDRTTEDCLYIGDSLNDAPMFAFFANSVGVANVRRYADELPALPRWVTDGTGGAGFVEIAEALIAARE